MLPQHLPAPASIVLRRARIARVLGLEIADLDVERILRALGMAVDAVEGGWQVTAPARRFDIAIEEDLIEELARIHGYEAIPTTLPAGATRIAVSSETRLDEATVRRQLAAREFLETINYAFVDAGLLDRWQLSAGAVPLANPLSAEVGVMRTALLPGLVDALQRNTARQAGRVRLFELGNVFQSREPAAAAHPALAPLAHPCASGTGHAQQQTAAPAEVMRVAAAICGEAHASQWGEAARKSDFHDLKGDLDSLAAATGAALEYRPSTRAFGHPGRSADVLRDGHLIGWIGQLHPRLQRVLDLDAEVLAFELDLSPLTARALPGARELSRYPSVRRDLAFVVADQVPWAAIANTVRSAAGPWLRDVVVFDRYVGQGVESGQKSLAMGLILQDNSRTLTDRDVEGAIAGVIAAIERDHGARIRG